jgi:hypothetical protein
VVTALAAHPPLAAGRSRALLLFLGVTAVALLAGSLWFRRMSLASVAAALIGFEYVSYLHAVHERLSTLTPLYAAALILTTELADASITTGWGPDTVAAVTRRAKRALVVALLALALAAALLGLAREVTLRGPWVGPVGLIAVSALLLVVVALAQEIAPRRSPRVSAEPSQRA